MPEGGADAGRDRPVRIAISRRHSRPWIRPRRRTSPLTRRHRDRPDRQDRSRDGRVAWHRASDRHPSRDAGRRRRVHLQGQCRGSRRDRRHRRGPWSAGAGRPGRRSQPETAEAVVKSVLEAFDRIDILVNNAGVTRDDLIMRMSIENWREVLETNLFGAFYMIKAVTRPMLKAKGGRIVNITSVSGQAGQMGQANYSSAKAGLIGLTKATARELASRTITCNAVAPGFVDHRADARPARGTQGAAPRGDAARAIRRDRGDRGRGRLPRQRRGGVHHRSGARRRRRPGDDVGRPRAVSGP